jgi:hypothetical protein
MEPSRLAGDVDDVAVFGEPLAEIGGRLLLVSMTRIFTDPL